MRFARQSSPTSDTALAERSSPSPQAQRSPAGPGNQALGNLLKRQTGPSPQDGVRSVVEEAGEAIDPGLRAAMEARLGRPLGEVRIHRDGRAARSAQAVNAKAYTLGNHVVFGPGQYAPNSQAGRTVIAHELMHVLQRSGRSSLGVMPPTARGEAQAEAGGQGQAAAPVTSAASSAGGVGRMAEKDLTSLDDGQLQNEYQMTQQWINDHPEGDDHAAGISYMREIEAEVTRRSSSTGPDGGVDASAGGQGPRTDQTQTAQRADGGDQGQCPIPMVCDPGFTPGTTTAAAVSSGDSQSSSLPPLSQQVTRMTAAHAGGAMGERDMAFALGQQGHEFYAGPGGPGGHGLTEHGFDGVSYNPTNGETWLIDNKASGRLSTVRSATAISSNLEAGLVDAIATISAQPASPNQPQVLQNLQTALAAVRAGQPLPSNVKLKVTNAGGYSTGVSKGLQSQGVQFEDLTGPNIQAARAQDIATAKAQGVKSGRPASYSGTDEMAPTTVEEGAGGKGPGPGSMLGGVLTSVGINAALMGLNLAMSALIAKSDQGRIKLAFERQAPAIQKAVDQAQPKIQKLQADPSMPTVWVNVGVLITFSRQFTMDLYGNSSDYTYFTELNLGQAEVSTTYQQFDTGPVSDLTSIKRTGMGATNEVNRFIQYSYPIPYPTGGLNSDQRLQRMDQLEKEGVRKDLSPESIGSHNSELNDLRARTPRLVSEP